ncbi:dicarboxylate transporter/tellurite-resistance protein TehA [Uliginosibacterium gangwonense]|uniref:dicarboxylate transporter/tellurite-resistance protein TehA n=1 Tax=Uliginosibacterium gangwonense TaxID=392736 RepID=UPI000367AD5F|nr:dicarboxylate transporter/tellurite-resistance protein TehA [Uliginosibacterium gangwonense]
MRRPLSASFFGMVLGLSGLGQAWRVANKLWGLPSLYGELLLLLAAVVWAVLLMLYVQQSIRRPLVFLDEVLHPVQGSATALLAVATFLIALAVLPYSRLAAWLLTGAALIWHLAFALWHTGSLWQGGRDVRDSTPALYLPTVAGNFTCAAALGGLGHADWGWLFLGAGAFSWLALEPLVIQRLWHLPSMPAPQRPLLGIQFAPPVVCAMAALMLVPGGHEPWLLMLWGYGLFQLLLGLRLGRWLSQQPFAPSYWAYTFGVAATTVSCLKLALAGVVAAQVMAWPIFIGANLFIGYLTLRTVWLWRLKDDT